MSISAHTQCTPGGPPGPVGPGGPGGPALPLVPTPADRRREVCVAQAISVQGHVNTWGMQIHTVIYIELCIEVELLTFCCPAVHANTHLTLLREDLVHFVHLCIC